MNFEEFSNAAAEKHRRGVEQYRPNGGSFKGNPVMELADECLDEYNYANECYARGYFDEEEHHFWTKRAFEGWMRCQVVMFENATPTTSTEVAGNHGRARK